jgi:hypothetical protein
MKTDRPEHLAHEDAPANAFTVMFNGSAGAVERSASLFGKSMRSLQEESMRFLTRRMEDNAKAAKEIVACRSFPDLLAVQQKWFADTARAYGEEWLRCGELVTEMLEESGKEEAGKRVRGRPEHH